MFTSSRASRVKGSGITGGENREKIGKETEKTRDQEREREREREEVNERRARSGVTEKGGEGYLVQQTGSGGVSLSSGNFSAVTRTICDSKRLRVGRVKANEKICLFFHGLQQWPPEGEIMRISRGQYLYPFACFKEALSL